MHNIFKLALKWLAEVAIMCYIRGRRDLAWFAQSTLKAG